MPATTIFIADDHHIVVEGIKRLLSRYPEFSIVDEAYDGYEVVKKATALKPDIVIMDIELPGINGIEATKQLLKLCPKTRIIIFSMYSDKEYVIDLFKAGISGYVLKEDPSSELILAIKAAQGGGNYFSTNTPSILLRYMEMLEKGQKDGPDFETLSPREKEVFCLLVEGKPVKEIAAQLCISPKTVGSHKYNIMEKLKARSMKDLIQIAYKKNLITF